MTDRSSYPASTFSWAELATSDGQAAKPFYTAVFGWTYDDRPVGPDMVYSMAQLEGRSAAALFTSDQPPHWNCYVTVESADDAAAKAKELGANVMAEPFDVMDAGRMAVLQDPTGAVFCLWQAARSIGARILYEPGALCWTELTTRDPQTAETFYTALFGWAAKHSAPGAPMEYTEFSNNGQPIVGMMKMPAQMPAEVPSYWMPYFQVPDCDASATKSIALGAKGMIPPLPTRCLRSCRSAKRIL